MDEQQVRLVKQLAPPDGNVCVIGDPDQSIYGFRGADVRFFSEFQRDFPGAKVVRLSRNYRSVHNIVTLSSQVIARAGSSPSSGPSSAPPSAPRSESPSALPSEPAPAPPVAPSSGPAVEEAPELVTIHEAPTGKAEAEFVVQSLERMLGGHSFFSIDSGRSPDGDGHDLSLSDFAVLYRTEAQVAVLAEALRRSGLPFQQRSHRRLLEHPGVTAIMDALREAPGAGPIRARIDVACSAVERPPAERPEASVLLEARELLRPLAGACGDDLERFLSALSLDTEIDTWDPRADRISLLTLHAAKGLEFPVVFIAGCENGLLPLTWGKAEPAALDEERRLFYVGVTRAKTKLYLCRAKKRLWRGKVRELPPSPYLADVEERLLERRRSRIPGKRKKADGQMKLFS